MNVATIGIGANLADPRRQIGLSLSALSTTFTLLAQSSLYRSAPVSEIEQPDYINAVVLLRTELSPHELLVRLLAIEHQQGRQRDSALRWGPRQLDLDLLLYGDRVIETPDLCVPHPQMRQRAFVVLPLLEIAPDLRLPGGELLADVAQSRLIQTQEIERIL